MEILWYGAAALFGAVATILLCAVFGSGGDKWPYDYIDYEIEEQVPDQTKHEEYPTFTYYSEDAAFWVRNELRERSARCRELMDELDRIRLERDELWVEVTKLRYAAPKEEDDEKRP